MTNKLINQADILAAQDVIRDRLHRTPLMSSTLIGRDLGCTLHLKMELFQKTGSFKPRGVLNKLHHLTNTEIKKGVISLSAGNHAQAVAWSAAQVPTPATIFMPVGSYPSKIAATRNYGAEVVLTGGDLLAECLERQKADDLTLIHPFDDLHVIAGQATVGQEIVEDLPDVDTVVIAVGGGGLISGVATALKLFRPTIRVIGVEPEGAKVVSTSLAAGKPIPLDNIQTIADGLSAPFTGQRNLDHIKTFVDEMVIVSDLEIKENLWYLIERTKVLAEPSAVAPLAALQSGKINYAENEKICLIICGGNIDKSILQRILEETK